MKTPGSILALFPVITLAFEFIAMADDPASIVPSINQIGIDLYRTQAAGGDGNLLLSPYSIATALAMTYAGADGETKAEMQRVLHLSPDEVSVGQGFGSLAKQLADMTAESKKQAARAEEYGGSTTPTEVTVANRLFVQKGYALRAPFVALLSDVYRAPLDQLDFRADSEKSRVAINGWVDDQTRKKIRDLIPEGGIKKDTRVVLANAVYLHAAWLEEFSEKATGPEKFSVKGGTAIEVPTMRRKILAGFAKNEGFTSISLPYAGQKLAFVVLLPDTQEGLAKLEVEVTAELLAKQAQLPRKEVELHLPKFRIEPQTVRLASALKSLGMKTAFDEPKQSANFDQMAPRKPDEYLYIGEVFHKAFLALDEHGTEAAAATAVAMLRATAAPIEKPEVVRVDRPFVFAIQHIPSATCLFLGRVTDPR